MAYTLTQEAIHIILTNFYQGTEAAITGDGLLCLFLIWPNFFTVVDIDAQLNTFFAARSAPDKIVSRAGSRLRAKHVV